MFRAPAMLLPHESTVAHEQRFIMDEPMISRTRLRQEPHVEEIGQQIQQANDEITQITQESLNIEDLRKLQVNSIQWNCTQEKRLQIRIFSSQLNDKGNAVPHTRPVTPRSVTHNHDEDYSDEESDPNAKSDEDRFNHSSSDEK